MLVAFIKSLKIIKIELSKWRKIRNVGLMVATEKGIFGVLLKILWHHFVVLGVISSYPLELPTFL